MGVVSIDDFKCFSPVFRGKLGQGFARWFMRAVSIDRINQLYDNSSNYYGSEFASRFLKDLNVKYSIGNAERLKHLPDGAFITVCNHPYGGLDGIILVDLMNNIRPDYKLMVNQILSLVNTMKDSFISVTPVIERKLRLTSVNLHGIRYTLDRLQHGHPVGFFPSGAVSDLSLKEFRIRDREWQPGIIHLIRSAKVPVLPIRFFDSNSPLFYLLGLLDWRIRLLKMPSELFNKTQKEHRIGIGRLISVEEQEHCKDTKELGIFLRNAVYQMPLPSLFLPRNQFQLIE